MTRNMDLIRAILLELERHQDPVRPLDLQAPGASPEQVAYHVRLLHEAGFVDAVDFSSVDGLDWRPRALTWRGHEFLDATRSDRVWHKLKAELKDRGVSLPVELLQQLALKIAAAAAGL